MAEEIRPSSIKSKKILSVDIIRTVAMLMVVYLHTIYSFTMRLDFFATKSWFIFEPFAALSRASMALFFILSGYLVINKKRTIQENFQKTISRIVVPLLLFSLFYILFQVYKYKLPLVSGLWQQFLVSLVDFPNNWLWFLMVLLFLYILNPLWNIVFFNNKNQNVAIYITKLFFIFSLLTNALKFIMHKPDFFNSFTSWLGYLPLYLYGGLVRNKLVHIDRRILNISLILAGLMISVICDYYVLYALQQRIYFPYTGYFTDNLNLFAVLLGLGIFNFVISIETSHISENYILKSVSRVFTFLAGLSYGIYLIHPFLTGFLSEVRGVSIDNSKMNIYVFNIGYYLSILIGSSVITFIIIKIPKLRRVIGEE